MLLRHVMISFLVGTGNLRLRLASFFDKNFLVPKFAPESLHFSEIGSSIPNIADIAKSAMSVTFN